MINIYFIKSNVCTPCKMMTPIVEQIKEGLNLNINTLYVEVDKDKIAEKYNVRTVPTIIIEKDGEVKKQVGYTPYSITKKFLEGAMI